MYGFLTARSEAAHVRVGHAQVFVRIDWDIVDADFVVKVWAGAASAIADVADRVAPVYVLPGINRKALHVSVACGDAVAVVEDDRPTISAHEVGEFYDTFGRRHNRLPVNRTDIDARVECAFTVERINTLAE